VLLIAIFGGATRAAADIPPDSTLVYVGTYSGPKAKGIYLFRLETPSAAGSQNIPLVPLGLAAEIQSPSFLEVDPKRRVVFAVNEVDKFQGKSTGAVSAFSIDPATGMLTLINQQPSMGTGPCHLVLDKSGKNILVANYGSGSVSVFPLAADGRLGEPSSVIQHTGKSVNAQRQSGPHAHAVALDPANQFAFVCDLGLDKVMSYRFDANSGKITPNDPPSAPLKPGSGPRHMVFRPDGRFAYVINEMSSTVTAFACDQNAGALRELQTISTLPDDFDGK
jgi:6-phosphogluconolactonase